jgi:hypothetical protein
MAQLTGQDVHAINPFPNYSKTFRTLCQSNNQRPSSSSACHRIDRSEISATAKVPLRIQQNSNGRMFFPIHRPLVSFAREIDLSS